MSETPQGFVGRFFGQLREIRITVLGADEAAPPLGHITGLTHRYEVEMSFVREDMPRGLTLAKTFWGRPPHPEMDFDTGARDIASLIPTALVAAAESMAAEIVEGVMERLGHPSVVPGGPMRERHMMLTHGSPDVLGKPSISAVLTPMFAVCDSCQATPGRSAEGTVCRHCGGTGEVQVHG